MQRILGRECRKSCRDQDLQQAVWKGIDRSADGMPYSEIQFLKHAINTSSRCNSSCLPCEEEEQRGLPAGAKRALGVRIPPAQGRDPTLHLRALPAASIYVSAPFLPFAVSCPRPFDCLMGFESESEPD